MMTFREYCRYREGLWLNDKNAIVGLSKIAPPEPRKKPKPRPTAPPKIRPVQATSPSKPVGESQMPDTLTMMSRMGISLVEPDNDQMERLVDKTKTRVVVPHQPGPPTPPLQPAEKCQGYVSPLEIRGRRPENKDLRRRKTEPCKL